MVKICWFWCVCLYVFYYMYVYVTACVSIWFMCICKCVCVCECARVNQQSEENQPGFCLLSSSPFTPELHQDDSQVLNGCTVLPRTLPVMSSVWRGGVSPTHVWAFMEGSRLTSQWITPGCFHSGAEITSHVWVPPWHSE